MIGFEMDTAPLDVDLDHVAVPDRGDGAAVPGFGRDVADAGAAAVALRADVAAGHHHFARPVKHVFHFEILAGEGADLLFGFFRSLGNNRNAADRRGGGDNGSGLE